MAKANVLCCNLLVKTTGKDDTTGHELGQNIGGSESFGKVDGSHAVCLVLGLGSELLEAHVGNGLLDLLRGGAVIGEALGEGHGGDLCESGVESVDELWGRSSKVGWLSGLVVLHD